MIHKMPVPSTVIISVALYAYFIGLDFQRNYLLCEIFLFIYLFYESTVVFV